MILCVLRGTPTIRELALRRKGGQWTVVIVNGTPEFRIVTGLRRITNQQLQPMRQLGMPLTPEAIDREKWNAFWDAPLDLGEPTRAGNPPPAAGVAH